MNKTPYEVACELKDILNNDPRVLSLNKIEKEMNISEEVMSLAYKKDMMALNYSDILKLYPDNSPEAVSRRKALHEAKKDLESHPLVKEYLRAYQQVRELYQMINNILFKDLNPFMCPKE